MTHLLTATLALWPVLLFIAVVAGFCICNYISERAFQTERGGQWMKGKGCPTFGPIGPWLVTPDELEPGDLRLRSRVNGEPRQDSSTAATRSCPGPPCTCPTATGAAWTARRSPCCAATTCRA